MLWMEVVVCQLAVLVVVVPVVVLPEQVDWTSWCSLVKVMVVWMLFSCS